MVESGNRTYTTTILHTFLFFIFEPFILCILISSLYIFVNVFVAKHNTMVHNTNWLFEYALVLPWHNQPNAPQPSLTLFQLFEFELSYQNSFHIDSLLTIHFPFFLSPHLIYFHLLCFICGWAVSLPSAAQYYCSGRLPLPFVGFLFSLHFALFGSVQYSSVQFSIVQYSSVQFNTIHSPSSLVKDHCILFIFIWNLHDH